MHSHVIERQIAGELNARPEQVETYIAAGFDGCIAKPLTLAALSAALGARVSHHASLT